MTVYDKIERILNAARSVATREGESYIEDIRLMPGYAEPGYSDPESGWVAFGNWNKITKYVEAHWEQFRFPKNKKSRISRKWAKRKENLRYVSAHFKDIDDVMGRIHDLLEKLGVECEWSDEWTECQDCQKAVRTSPDSYGWTPAYWDSEYGTTCQECVKSDPGPYLEDLEGNHRKALTLDIDLAEHGYRHVDQRFENGWHPGQDADPKLVAKALKKMGITRFIFSIDSVGQFDMDFSVWVHEEEWEKFDEARLTNTNGPSNSEG